MRTQFWKVWFPTGEWGVLEVAEEEPGRHEVLGRFPSESRADAYLKFCANQPKSEPARASVPTRQSVDSIVAGVVKAATYEPPRTITHFVRDLQSLWEMHPEGISSKIVVEHFRIRYDEACEILRWADRSGHGRWVYTHDRRDGKRFVPLSKPMPAARTMTDQQEQLMKALVRVADANGCVQLSYSDMAREADVKRGSLSYLIERLMAKGSLMLAKPAHDGAPAIYQVLRHAQPAETDSQQRAN